MPDKRAPRKGQYPRRLLRRSELLEHVSGTRLTDRSWGRIFVPCCPASLGVESHRALVVGRVHLAIQFSPAKVHSLPFHDYSVADLATSHRTLTHVRQTMPSPSFNKTNLSTSLSNAIPLTLSNRTYTTIPAHARPPSTPQMLTPLPPTL